MVVDNEWIVVFFVDEKGFSPIREFLQSLDLKTQARFVWSIEHLRVRNVRAQEPLVRHLEGKLWELREESSTNIYRLLYFFFQVGVLYSYMVFRRRLKRRLDMKLR